jgi:nucleotide-binding universal stress UspA family protein
VQALYVADTARGSVTTVTTEVVGALAVEGEETVETAAAELERAGANYVTDVVQGDPVETILEYAGRYDADLIAMPSRGHEGLSRYLLGSVAEKVVRLSTVPVLVARLQPDERLSFPYERILVPTDGSDQALRAARHALELAAALEAEVHVLSVVDDARLGVDVRSAIGDDVREERATDAIRGVETAAADVGIDPVTAVERGPPAATIREYVDDHGADLVVVGTTGRRGLDRVFLGSVAERTIRSAPVPTSRSRTGDRDRRPDGGPERNTVDCRSERTQGSF